MSAQPPPGYDSDPAFDKGYEHLPYQTVGGPKEGFQGGLTGSQKDAVKVLRLQLTAKGKTERLDTNTLLRFLRARKWDVQLAEKMFLDCENWRECMTASKVPLQREKGDGTPVKLDAETIREWDKDGSFKQKVSTRYKQFYHKTDKDGRPVYFEQLGGIDLYAMANEGITEDKMLINLAVEYEKMADPRLPACSRKTGHLLETCTSIMDLKGVGLGNAGSVYGYITKASGMSNNCYPERLGHMYLINCPWGFSMVWNVVRNLLDPVTAAKIHVCGSGWKKEVMAQVSEENLPSIYGGKCKCEKYGGCENSDMGPWNPNDEDYEKCYRAPWWSKEAEAANTINNEAPEVTSGDGAAAAPAEAGAGATEVTEKATA